jgi:hypothetical protein
LAARVIGELMLGDEMIFILTRFGERSERAGEPNDRIVVQDEAVFFRGVDYMNGEDYDIEMTDTKFGQLLLEFVNQKSNSKVKSER